MKKCILISAVALFALASCNSDGYKTTDRGVIVTVDQNTATDVRKVRVEVVGEKLIHVSATPEKKFSKTKSLTIIDELPKVPYTVESSDSTVTVSTTAISATICRATGHVTFADSAGNTILAEDSRTFEAVDAEAVGTVGAEVPLYTAQQVFETDSTEAFFGLGQHQADEFNYKGKNEELFQYNTKVSVPFIVSSRKYGVLWDSYSLLRFGDPRPYAQLNRAFTLYDKDGEAGGLTGTYINGEQKVVRTEDSLYFEDLMTIKNLPEAFPLYGSDVTYEGYIEPKDSGTFRFILYYAGYMKVYINNEIVVPERWRTAWNPNSYKFAVDLEANIRVPIRVEWQPDGGESYCGLRVLTPVEEEVQNKLSWWGEVQEQIDYYFVYGESIDDVISGYRTLTGKAQIMPRWAMGFWQSRERYKTQDEIVSTLREFRERRIPIDNIVQDWSYWPEDAWGSHEFDSLRYPDPQAMVDSIHALHGHMMISVWPKFYTSTEHFKEFDSKGWMYRQAVEDSLRDWIGQGYHYSFYDAYSEGARKLFWEQMNEHLYCYGIDAWWMDASEPNVRDCTPLLYRKQLCGSTALGSSAQYFNAYALVNAMAIYGGQRSVNPNSRVFLLTRSGFAGLQRYSTATWSGDIATRWEDMKAQISAGINFSISGIPYWTMDIGGFCVEKRYEKAAGEYLKSGRENSDLKEWRELNTRWYQFGAFCPLYRAHGQWPTREIWNIAPEGHPCYESMVYYTKLRYALMPYVYSLASMTWFNDYTIMRALVMDYTDDAGTYNIGDQFLFGPSLMVCPVYEYGARSRKVYFPAGKDWYDYYTGEVIAGGQTKMVAAPYERIPLYVPAGSILLYGPEIQYADEKAADVIEVAIYGGADGAFTLYEDENTNYNYEDGAYATISFTYNDAEGTLSIGKRKGTFEGMLNERTFIVHRIGKSPVEVKYDGASQVINL